ncbi:MAG: YeeE/YedE family protein [Burkholderiales bacterium]
MTDPASIAKMVVWGAFTLGLVFGFVGNKTHFCTMGAVGDIVNMGDWNRMRMWLLAMAVAILGTAGLQGAGMIDVSKTIYATPNFMWLSFVIGGFLFGVGMTLASGCGSKTLIRVGAGNLKSLLVLIVAAISAYMTLRGLFGVFRVWAIDPVAIKLPANQDLPSLAAFVLGSSRGAMLSVVSLLVAGGLLVFVFAKREFLSFDNLLGGTVTGLVIVGGWYLSGHLGYLPEDPNTLEERFYATNSGRMESFSFVAPQAYLLELLMFWSDVSRVMTFGIAAALGTMIGSFLWAMWSRSFRLESFREPEDMINHIVGGVLMGFGGILGLGCTIGQGLSGVSTLALGSILVLLSIIAGGVVAMKYQYWRIGG